MSSTSSSSSSSSSPSSASAGATPSKALATRANAALADSAHLKPFGPLETYSASCPWSVFPRKKLDVTFSDIAVGLRGCLSLSEAQRDEYLTTIARHWVPSGQAMVTLSVRTGFDLLLQTLKLPAGSEILCSAITIPDMIYIVKYHNLVPVPVDLHPDTLSVNVEQLRGAVTAKTRAILVAHIFGSRHPMDDVMALADELSLIVIEDCAQAFIGMEYTGERGADVSMFSFGTIKTTTAFGGALIKVKNAALLEEMRRRESRYPARSTAFFMKRLIKYGAVHSLSTPAIYGLAMHTVRGLGGDFDKVITAAIRGFSGGELVSLIRFRPSMPLLGLLHHRLTAVDDAYIELRRLKSELLADAIADIPNVEIPGRHARSHYYWLFPVLVPQPAHVAKYMNQQGFDVTSGATQLAFISSPKGEQHDPVVAKRIMAGIIYLPITAETPDWGVHKMVQSLKEALQASRL